ncbi:MAG: hypothetical protein AAGF47_08565 [Planctomycetota bacterium]
MLRYAVHMPIVFLSFVPLFVLLFAGCASVPVSGPARNPADAVGSWTLDDPRDTHANWAPIESSLIVSDGGFDRVTLIDSGDRRIEVSESGRWTPAPGGMLSLSLDNVLLVITERGDVSVESYRPGERGPGEEGDPGSASARLRLVGDRLILEMLNAGKPETRFAYRRD